MQLSSFKFSKPLETLVVIFRCSFARDGLELKCTKIPVCDSRTCKDVLVAVAMIVVCLGSPLHFSSSLIKIPVNFLYPHSSLDPLWLIIIFLVHFLS